MNLTPNEVRVLSVLHHYEAELEKIAKSRSIKRVFTPADLKGKIRALKAQQAAVGEEIGTTLPFGLSQRGRAKAGAQARYQKDIDKYERELKKRLDMALKDMQEGRNLDAARAEIRAQQAIPKKTKPLKVDAPGAAPKKSDENAEHWLKTESGRRAALLGTGTAIGAAGLYAANRALQGGGQGGDYGGY